MRYISHVGLKWLDYHNVRFDRAHDMFNTYGYCPQKRIDDGCDHYGQPLRDYLFERKSHWCLDHTHTNFHYREMANGRAKIKIQASQLPETVINALHDSENLLYDIIEVEPRSPLSFVNTKIIRAENLSENKVGLLLRLTWYELSQAWLIRGGF